MQLTSVQKHANKKEIMKKTGGNDMFKNMRKRVKNEKGLTLVELLAVVVILGIISAIAVPAIGNVIENSRYNALKADAINVLNAGQLYYTDNPEGEAASGSAGAVTTTRITAAQLINAGYLESRGDIPATATVTRANPHELSTTAISVNGTTVTFTGADITEINNDTVKGSAIPASHVIDN